MFVKSNIDRTLIPIAELLNRLDLTDELNQIAGNAVIKIEERLKRGIGANGEILDTKARQRIGRYSKWHGENRRYKGLTTDVRNLNYTGKMIADFGVLQANKKQSSIGFKSIIEAEKAKKNEDYMDADVFMPNDQEIATGQKILNDKISAIIK
jgi:hypothetical protein